MKNLFSAHHTLVASTLISASLLMLSACGDPEGDDTTTAEAEVTPDGVSKQVDGKSDAWNYRNDPKGFRAVLDYNFENMPREGATNVTPWTDTYWPYYQDGINVRWQRYAAIDEASKWKGLSPAEKYDLAFNGWKPVDGFKEMKPFNTTDCTFDQEYYDNLGPVATWTHKNKGLGRMTDGIDGDRDGVEDAEECAQVNDNGRKDFDGAETWWGICHAWAPAALMEEEPLAPVERNGVVFEVSDIKAFLTQQWDRSQSYMVGGRCEEDELERDEHGRVTNSDCRDLNAGSWHVIVTNFIGLNKKGMVIERTTNYQVWNQPLFGYRITEQEEISLQKAHELLKIEQESTGNGTFVYDVEEESMEAKAILAFVNDADLETLDDDARLDARAAKNIIAARSGADGQIGTSDDVEIETLAELGDVKYVAEKAFGQLLGYALANGYSQYKYLYNLDAERFVKVSMVTDWITEQHPSTERSDTIIDRYTNHDYYDYILELDAEGKIIGGEWIGDSILNHPDFVWLPVRDRAGNPHIDTDLVRDLVRESREIALGPDMPAEKDLSAESVVEVPIPDNSVDGVGSTIEISETGTVETVSLNLELRHTYKGDLTIELRHGGMSFNVFNGVDADNASADDVILDAQLVNGFEGSNLSGDWELYVVDSANADVGRIVKWSLDFTIKD